MKFFALSVLLFVVFSNSNAQHIIIKDIETNYPIPHAEILAEDGNSYGFTDKNGKLFIPINSVDQNITVYASGYQSMVFSLAEISSKEYIVLLTRSVLISDEIVVSASQWQQHSNTLPQSIIKLTQKELVFNNPQTVADFLGNSGKVFIQKSQQGGGSPMIRGFATNRLIYSIDGIRMNTAIFRAGNIQNVISLDAFALDNTEVLFGPNSVIYGSDAIGGVMNFTTIKPVFSNDGLTYTAGNMIGRFSSANSEKTGHIDFKVGGSKLASATSISYNDFGDLRMGTKGPVEYVKKLTVVRVGNEDKIVPNSDSLLQNPSAYNQINITQKLSYKPSGYWLIDYGFHFSKTSEYSRYDRHIRYRNGNPRYGEWKYGPQKWMMNALTISHNKSTTYYSNMKIKLAYQVFDESRIDRDINRPTRHTRIEKVNAYSLNFDFTKILNDSKKVFYGFESVLNDVISTGFDEDIILNTKFEGPSRYPKANWASYAAYAKYHSNITSQWSYEAAARYNFVSLVASYDNTFYPFPFTMSTNNSGALTGSLGSVLNINPSLSIYANASTAFRAPNVDDTGKVFDSAPGIVVVPNPDLKPEYAYNGELGFNVRIGDYLKFEVSGYYTYLKDALVRRPYTLNGLDSIVYSGELSQVNAIQNAAKATVYGFQSTIQVQILSSLSLVSNYNVQIGNEELDNGDTSPSRHAAPAFGNTDITWSKKKWVLAVVGFYSQGKSFDQLPFEEQGKPELYASDADGKPYSPSWYTLTARSQYLINSNMSVQLALENITDQRYRPYSSGMTGPGRNIVTSFQLKF